MAYQYDLFISYKRSARAGTWVRNHLVPRLQACLDELTPNPLRLSFDANMQDGANWPADLRQRLLSSRLLVAVWNAPYFQSAWCMAEWKSFKAREEMLGLFSDARPQGLVYPVRYADGDSFPEDAHVTQCHRDFSALSYPDEHFATSAKYMEFDDQVQSMASELVAALARAPEWRSDFPVVEPLPEPARVLARMTL